MYDNRIHSFDRTYRRAARGGGHLPRQPGQRRALDVSYYTVCHLCNEQDIEEGGGLRAALDVFRASLGAPTLAAAAAGLCRQLANRDACKDGLAAAGALPLVVRAAAVRPDDLPLLEQVGRTHAVCTLAL